MTYSTTYGLIILALDMTGQTSPASLDRIIGAADSLNKAIPSHSDLQAAIGWLLQEGFICRQGRDYGLTQLGRDLVAEVKSQAANPFDGIDVLKKRLTGAGAPIELADISEVEWQQAYDTYHKRMEMLRR